MKKTIINTALYMLATLLFVTTIMKTETSLSPSTQARVKKAFIVGLGSTILSYKTTKNCFFKAFDATKPFTFLNAARKTGYGFTGLLALTALQFSTFLTIGTFPVAVNANLKQAIKDGQFPY